MPNMYMYYSYQSYQWFWSRKSEKFLVGGEKNFIGQPFLEFEFLHKPIVYVVVGILYGVATYSVEGSGSVSQVGKPSSPACNMM